MKKEFVITMKMSFVSSHMNDARLPMENVATYLSVMLEGKAKVSGTRYMTARVVTGSKDLTEKAVSDMVCAALADSYGEAEYEKIVTVTAEKSTESEDEEEQEDNDEFLSPLARRFAELARKQAKEKEPESEDEREDAVGRVLEKISALVGCAEYKRLCEQLVSVAPIIRKNKAYDAFSGQAYLFAINDGCGVTTVTRCFAELLSALGLRKTRGNSVFEEKLDPPKGESDSAFSSVKCGVESCSESNHKLFCVDISEWMSRIDTRLFRAFLTEIAKNAENCTLIFRIPFVEKSVMDKVSAALSEAMFVREVSFPPFSESELRAFAESEVKKQGYKLTVTAWPDLYERIKEEKAKGSYYGVQTVRKVVRELLYKKQFSIFISGKNSRTVTKDDTKILHSQVGLAESPYAMLDKMVCTEGLKTRIEEIVSQILLSMEDETVERPCIHMRFVGNPGTGKTTVARIVGKILKERGVLRTGRFFEHHGRDFVGRYIGETAPKTLGICRDAYGSVLFIDEAYSLSRTDPGDRDFGKEAIDTLIAEMENHRDDMVVIMAGYTDDMEKLMQTNSGLVSRMPYVIEFPNFTREQLHEIFVRMLANKRYDKAVIGAAREYFSAMPDGMINAKDFANGRFVRNLFERAFAKAATRSRLAESEQITLMREDFERAIMDKEFAYERKRTVVGFCE